MQDGLEKLFFYKEAQALYDVCWADTDKIRHDGRGKVLSVQMIRSMGSIPANIEEGYGRGFGKEYPRFLRIARGSAQETKGWYDRSRFLLPQDIVDQRKQKLNYIIACITKTINTISERNQKTSGPPKRKT
ncbi:MAG TPA: four helix bundle protein [Bacteroidia bacterium]|jgi:four helix bundle protein|nr:four helix bundle protein [Bacteroidia bacterium]